MKKNMSRAALISFTTVALMYQPYALAQIPTATTRPGYEWVFKDGIIIESPIGAPTPTPFPAKTDYEAVKRSIEKAKVYARSMGYDDNDIGYEEPSLETKEPSRLRYFELPHDQEIPGCIYAKGYSFPDFCYESSSKEGGNKLTFEAGKDPQSRLDEIKESSGIKGEFNVVRDGHKARLSEVDGIIHLPD